MSKNLLADAYLDQALAYYELADLADRYHLYKSSRGLRKKAARYVRKSEKAAERETKARHKKKENH